MYVLKQRVLIAAGVFSAALAAGCGSDPVAPTTSQSTTTSTAPSTLKVSSPAIVSPAGGAALNTRTPALVLRPALGIYGSPTVSYEFQVLTTAGDPVYSRNVAGGPANGQGTVSHVVDTALGVRTGYRWRARATMGANVGPWTDAASGPAMFVTTTLTPASTNDEFRDYFFSLIAQKNLGPTATQAGIQAMAPELTAVGIIIAQDSSGSIRGRIYLPTGGADKFARSVDVVTGFGPGFTWTWVVRGATKCEGICP